MRADILEGEALWGDDFKKQFDKLFSLQHELFMLTRNHLNMINLETDLEAKKTIAKIIKGKRDIMYDHLDDSEDDIFKKELNEEIMKIREYLKPKIAD